MYGGLAASVIRGQTRGASRHRSRVYPRSAASSLGPKLHTHPILRARFFPVGFVWPNGARSFRHWTSVESVDGASHCCYSRFDCWVRFANMTAAFAPDDLGSFG